MSLGVAPNAVKLGKHDSTETATIAMVMITTAIPPDAKSSLQCAPSVARKLKYRLNLMVTGLFTALIATVK